MGIDCMLFAARAKRCVWVDRHYNVGWIPNHEKHGGVWWLGFLLGMDKGTDVAAIDGHDNSYANRGKAREFIERHGVGDDYFVVTDHADPSCHEFAEANDFERDDDDGDADVR